MFAIQPFPLRANDHCRHRFVSESGLHVLDDIKKPPYFPYFIPCFLYYDIQLDLVHNLRTRPSRHITCGVHPGTSHVSKDCNNRRNKEVNQYSFLDGVQPYTLNTSLHCTAPRNETNRVNVYKTLDRKRHQRTSLLISTLTHSIQVPSTGISFENINNYIYIRSRVQIPRR
jgi:hypothetical protein